MLNIESDSTRPRAVVDAAVPAPQKLLLDILDTVREPLIVLDPEFRVIQANRSFFRTFRVEPENTIGQVLFTLGDGQWDIAPLRELLRDKLALEPQLHDFDVDHVFPGIGRKIMMLNARLVSQGPTCRASSCWRSKTSPSAASPNGASPNSAASCNARTRRSTSLPRWPRTTCRSRCERSCRSVSG